MIKGTVTFFLFRKRVTVPFIMVVKVFPGGAALAGAVAADAAVRLRGALAARERARIIAATGASQIAFLARLTRETGVDWRRVEMFHLDEYIGLALDHPASFRKYLLERLIRPAGILDYHLLDGEKDPVEACRQAAEAIRRSPIDVAFVGIGENGHLAFNDPPADFGTETPYIVVRLDEQCRRQQVGEGWFATLADVPETAISMSVRQILAARGILCVVPDWRKAEAVRATLEGPVTPAVPASILRTHGDVTVYLDRESAALLGPALAAGGVVPAAEDIWRVRTVEENS
jgi:glucosamine-6-phosphate deaminase